MLTTELVTLMGQLAVASGIFSDFVSTVHFDHVGYRTLFLVDARRVLTNEIPKYYLISQRGNFVEAHSFRRVFDKSPEN